MDNKITCRVPGTISKREGDKGPMDRKDGKTEERKRKKTCRKVRKRNEEKDTEKEGGGGRGGERERKEGKVGNGRQKIRAKAERNGGIKGFALYNRETVWPR